MEGTWTLGVLVGLPILAVVNLVLLVGAALFFRWARRNPHHVNHGLAKGSAMVCLGVMTVVLVMAASPLGFYPYEAEYHRWEPKVGKVAAIEKRLVSSGDSMEETFVVQFAGDPHQYRIDDTRAALVEVGTDLAITCKRQWQYAATDGYVCRWLGVR